MYSGVGRLSFLVVVLVWFFLVPPLKEGFLLCVQADWFSLHHLRAPQPCSAGSVFVISDSHATKIVIKSLYLCDFLEVI